MASRVHVGDTVRLNRDGLLSIFGTDIGLGPVMQKTMKITYVSDKSITSPEEMYDVYVDDLEFNQFILTDHDFTVVR